MPVEIPELSHLEPHPLPRLIGHHCFACGTTNPIGLHMRFSLEGGDVRGDVTLHQDHQGWVDMAHGGIVSTLLDEIMAWSVIARERKLFVTRRMEISFVRPVPLEQPLVARGGLKEAHSHGVFTWARLEDADGRMLARAKADMVYVPEAKLGLKGEALRQDMEELFAAMESAVG